MLARVFAPMLVASMRPPHYAGENPTAPICNPIVVARLQ